MLYDVLLMSTERMKTLSKWTFLRGIKMVISRKVFRGKHLMHYKENDDLSKLTFFEM